MSGISENAWAHLGIDPVHKVIVVKKLLDLLWNA